MEKPTQSFVRKGGVGPWCYKIFLGKKRGGTQQVKGQTWQKDWGGDQKKRKKKRKRKNA